MALGPEYFSKPYVFLLTGDFLDAHSLLVERFREREIRTLAESHSCQVWPEVIITDRIDPRDRAKYQRVLAYNLFEKLDALDQLNIRNPSALALAGAKRGQRNYWVVQHDLEAPDFQNTLADFLTWYLDEFWKGARLDAGRFFVFLNVIYPPGTSRQSPVRQRIETQIAKVFPDPMRERNTDAAANGCPGWYLGELIPVDLLDVQKWVNERRIYSSAQVAYGYGKAIYDQAPRDPDGSVRMDGVYSCLEIFRMRMPEGRSYP